MLLLMQEDCEQQGQARLCVADEHFVATLLSTYYMTESIDRIGRLTYTDWQSGGWHPATFYPGNVTDHIAQMRSVSDAAMCAPPLLSPPRATFSRTCWDRWSSHAGAAAPMSMGASCCHAIQPLRLLSTYM